MSLTFLRKLKSFLILTNSKDSASLFSSYLTKQQFSSIQTPFMLDTKNFGFFVDKIKLGNDVPIVIGTPCDNETAAFIEKNFQQTIEFTGIISFTTQSDHFILQNRSGQYTIQNSLVNNVLIEPCIIFHLHDFQKDCIYITGLTSTALSIGISALLSFDSGPFFDILSVEDAVVVTGSTSSVQTHISHECSNISPATVDPSSLFVQSLRLVNSNIG